MQQIVFTFVLKKGTVDSINNDKNYEILLIGGGRKSENTAKFAGFRRLKKKYYIILNSQISQEAIERF